MSSLPSCSSSVRGWGGSGRGRLSVGVGAEWAERRQQEWAWLRRVPDWCSCQWVGAREETLVRRRGVSEQIDRRQASEREGERKSERWGWKVFRGGSNAICDEAAAPAESHPAGPRAQSVIRRSDAVIILIVSPTDGPFPSCRSHASRSPPPPCFPSISRTHTNAPIRVPVSHARCHHVPLDSRHCRGQFLAGHRRARLRFCFSIFQNKRRV